MAVTISEPPKSSNKDDGSTPTTIADILYSHFDAYQHDTTTSTSTSNNNNSSATRAAKELRIDLKSANIYEGEEGGTAEEQIASALLVVLDNTMSLIINSKKKDNYTDCVNSVLQLLAAFVCKENLPSSSSDNSSIVKSVIERTIEYTTVDKDTIRIESTKLLGLFSNYLLESSLKVKPSGILKKKKGGKKVSVKVSSEGEGGGEEVKDSSKGGTKGVQVDSWLMECITLITNSLTPRITDKIAKVRYSAIESVSYLLSSDGGVKLLLGESVNEGSDEGREEKEELTTAINNIQSKLLWIISNDTSATNRALVTTILPTNKNSATTSNTDNIQAIIVRIKDVDMKVRECALNSLRENVTLDLLDEDDCVDILRYGLTKRCSTTYAKTVELLCTNWLKSTKFDPIALLDKLNPVLNETVCEQVAQVLLRVANSIDCESSVEKGVELVQKHYSGAEVRSLQQMVLKKRNIIADGGVAAKKADGDEDGEDEDEDSTSPSPGMSPSMALFLRVKCESSTTTTDQISDIITDIPTLCNLLNTQIDKLIEFNNDEDYDEMDEDEAAAFEDDQNFVCLQLIHMAKSSDMEEGSRRHFISIMRRVLARLATPDDLVEACVKAMASAHDKEAHFLQTISEILVDVEDDDTFHSKEHDEKAIVIVRQMRIIAILSIVLESISGQMTEHPILDGFFQHLSPAITSKNAIVREHGVICLSKFCLLSGEDKVMEEFKPLLMTIAGSVEERVEVRAQAALALCDLSLIHKGMLGASNGGSDDESSSSFKSMLLEMLGHSKPGIVIIAAEITAKLLLSGRLSDPTLIAWLVLIYFDTSLTTDFDENDADAAEEVKQVGSPVRLQQLLSIFFPTYSMSSLDANDDMMASIGPLLTIVNDKLSGMKQAEVKEVLAQQFPIAKMVEYVCYNVDLADKKKNEEETTNKKEEETKDEAATVMGDKSVAASQQGDEEEDAETKVVAENDKAANKEGEEIITEASSTLLASIDVAEFLSEECDSAPTFYVRALAKILGSACIDIDTEDRALLRRLKSNVGEAEYANDDGPTVKSIKKLADLLVGVQDLVSDDEVSEEEEEEDEAPNAEEEEEVEEDGPEIVSVEKENPRLSMTSVKSVTSKVDGEERSVARASLGDVN